MAGNTPLNPEFQARLDDIDALLRRELAIEPSPQFLPRVRERIRHEPVVTHWRSLWLFPVGALAAACAAIFAVSVWRTAPVAAPAAPRLAIAAPIGAIAPVDLPPAHSAPVSDGIDNARPVRTPAVTTVAAAGEAPSLPVVLVDERQRSALALFIRVIQEGVLTEEAFARTTPVSLDPIRDGVKPLQVVPMTVNAIEVDGVLPSEKQ